MGALLLRRRLYRSRSDRVLGGVAGGIGDYFGLDSTIVRLVWIFLALWGGAGGLLYVIAWLIVPRRPDEFEAAASERYHSDRPRRISSNDSDNRVLGWVMVVIGLSVLVLNTPILGLLFSPAVLIGGALVIWGLFTVGKNGRPPRMH